MSIRIVNFVVDGSRDIIAADSNGSLYRLDEHLRLKRQSPKTYHGAGIHTIAADDQWVFTRDVGGNVIRWRKDTLLPEDFLVSQHFRAKPADDIQPAPSPAGAIAVRDGELYVSNAYGQLMVFGTDDMRCRRAIDIPSQAFPECLCLDAPGQDVLSDVLGTVWSGDVRGGAFRRIAQVPNGNMHCVRYDARFDRFWLSSDALGGLAIIGRNGEYITCLKMTRDDVEEMVFSSDHRYCYVVGFDHWLRIIENHEQPVVIDRIGPFKFQITHIRRLDDETVFVSLESGEIYRVDLSNRRVTGSAFGTNAVWYIEPHGQRLLCAMEAGNLEIITLTDDGDLGPSLQRRGLRNFGRGRVRKAVAIDDRAILAITTSGVVINCDWDGAVAWQVPTAGILRDIDVSADRMRAVVGNEAGEVFELDTSTGRLLRSYRHPRPVWCIAYDDAGHILVGERYLTLTPPADIPGTPTSVSQLTRAVEDPALLSSAISAPDPDIDGQLIVLDAESFVPIKSILGHGNFKRIQRLAPGKMLINGNGNIRVRIFDIERLEFEEKYDKWILNTPENAVVVDDHIYVVTYSQQLITYDRVSGEPVNVQFSCEGLPFSLRHYRNDDGLGRLIVAGRNFISIYGIVDGIPELMRTRILN
jgi:outer membrane protein assembly factor BamB